MSRGYSVWVLVVLSLSVFFPVHPIPINLEYVSKNQNTTRVLGVVTKVVGFFKLLESKLHKNSPSTSDSLGGQVWSSSAEPFTSPTPSNIYPEDPRNGNRCNTSPGPPTRPTPGDSQATASSIGVGTVPPLEPSAGHETLSTTEVPSGDNFQLPFTNEKMIDAPINMVSQCGQGLQKDSSGLCRRVW